ncbi:hypothetical protein ACH4F6_00595 [Streptomyces sp. NPDC017936]|uniref:hypothetical protein n=1 Tax=Streptomyces sp. NPDC017936 TaxID=3365016 RepID=UPI0037908884
MPSTRAEPAEDFEGPDGAVVTVPSAVGDAVTAFAAGGTFAPSRKSPGPLGRSVPRPKPPRGGSLPKRTSSVPDEWWVLFRRVVPAYA